MSQIIVHDTIINNFLRGKNENLYCTTDSACVNHKIHYVIYGILDYLHNYLYSADMPSIALL